MHDNVHASHQALPRGFAEHEHPREVVANLNDESNNDSRLTNKKNTPPQPASMNATAFGQEASLPKNKSLG